MKISIIGSGYVGLVSGTCFAEKGHNVVCIDNNEDKIKKMKEKIIPIYEPELENIFKKNIDNGNLTFSTDLKDALENTDVIFLCLPTPPGEDGSADLSYVLNVSGKIGELIKSYKIIVNKSTVPVGTSQKTKDIIKSKTSVPFDVVSNPEFLREGLAVKDFMNPDRIIIGTDSERVRKVMKEIYAPYIKDDKQLIFMDEKSSELTKYASNSFLATKITFMNEISNFCEKTGADVDMVRIGMGSDPRIGDKFLYPGIGYGGSCFPKDVKALIKLGNQNNFDFKILESVEKINDLQKVSLIKKLDAYFEGALENKKIALWGLAFKPETDDIREASSLSLIEELLKQKASVTSFDPEAMENVKSIIGNKISFAPNPIEAIKDADALLIATEWDIFCNIDLDVIKKEMKNPVIFDGRNIYPLDKMKGKGIYYESMGREIVKN